MNSISKKIDLISDLFDSEISITLNSYLGYYLEPIEEVTEYEEATKIKIDANIKMNMIKKNSVWRTVIEKESYFHYTLDSLLNSILHKKNIFLEDCALGEKLEKAIKYAKHGFFIDINPHFNTGEFYENKKWNKMPIDIVRYFKQDECDEQISPEILEKMIKNNRIFSLQIYPNSPVGFCKFFHYDFDLLISYFIKEF